MNIYFNLGKVANKGSFNKYTKYANVFKNVKYIKINSETILIL